jgi:hypothetical protein
MFHLGHAFRLNLSVTTMLCDRMTIRRQSQILIEEKNHGFCFDYRNRNVCNCRFFFRSFLQLLQLD